VPSVTGPDPPIRDPDTRAALLAREQERIPAVRQAAIACSFHPGGPGHGRTRTCASNVAAQGRPGASRGERILTGVLDMVRTGDLREGAMTDPDAPRFTDVGDGGYTPPAAEVAAAREAAGTGRAWLQAASGHVAPGRRANWADAVMDLPAVRASARLETTVPPGDTKSRLAAGGAPVRRSPRW
jgi:hypothetical protein